MKKLLIPVVMCFVGIAAFATDNAHFITDISYRMIVREAYNNKMKLFGNKFLNFKDVHLTTPEQEALEFLYAYMPIADVTDYPTSFYLENIKSSFQTRRTMAWGKKIPELLFRHFVLPIRVNNENLDSSRIVMYKELSGRVKGMSMQEAILEVNHWCHEHVTYHPSDARTLSPLACMKTAIGRCGEESTFTVAALRSIGIPARQVYTPRWAHTDDNHAWVEAWADGKWYFIGACEPEAVLNMGWFNAPASRALLMHTRAFGDYRGPEEVMLRTSNYTEINLIDNYGSSAKIDFRVIDEKGLPVEQARVEFKIYNYAEFYTAVNKYTDAQGKTFLTAGKGDMIVWASKNGKYGFAKASFGKDKIVTITLTHTPAADAAHMVLPLDSMDIVPPVEHTILPKITAEQNDRNKQRLAIEDSIRKAYEGSFYQGNNAYLKKARGNWHTISQFLDHHKDNIERVSELLNTLSDKDFCDITMEILEDNYSAPSNQLCPRVENEMIISPFKHIFTDAFPPQTAIAFRNDPALLVKWIKQNIKINPDKKALNIAQTPLGVWRSRLTDVRSRDIFFVDMARSLNIPARKDVITSKVQYRKDRQWIDVNFEQDEQKIADTGTLILQYSPTKYLDNPRYYSHFTISKIENGHATLLNFDEGQVDMGGGTSWDNTFKNGIKLDVGTYLLVTGTRLANGSVLSTCRIFSIYKNQETKLNLYLRTSTTEVSVIGNFDSEAKFLQNGKDTSILSQTGRGYFVIGILDVGQEPTNHALRDISRAKIELDKWQRPFVLLFENEKELNKFKSENYGILPQKTILGIDKDGRIKKQIVAQMKLQNENLLPIFIIADTFNRVVFSSQGYTIGLGEQIEKVIHKL